MSPFSNTMLECIRLIFTIKFSYIGDFIAWSPTHIIQISNEESTRPGFKPLNMCLYDVLLFDSHQTTYQSNLGVHLRKQAT